MTNAARGCSGERTPGSEPEHPLVFISHRHEDAKIAEAVAQFIEDITSLEPEPTTPPVEVFLSSNSEFVGPRIGKQLSTELRSALWTAEVVILIYTTPDKDWSWCMYECGVAAYPPDPETKVVVLQCSKEYPEVFSDAVRVVANNRETIVSFAQQFLDPKFFPSLGKPASKKSKKKNSRTERLIYIKDLRKYMFHRRNSMLGALAHSANKGGFFWTGLP